VIALNKEDKANGRYTRIDSIQWSENPVQGCKGLEFPVIFLSLFLRVILPCWYLILCFYERPLLSTVFGRLFQGGLTLRLNHYCNN
jgi:hypothetical protein